MEHVSREVGISAATLERWRADALANGSGAGSPRWTAAARLQAVIVTAAMDEATRSAWCREQGLYLGGPASHTQHFRRFQPIGGESTAPVCSAAPVDLHRVRRRRAPWPNTGPPFVSQ